MIGKMIKALSGPMSKEHILKYHERDRRLMKRKKRLDWKWKPLAIAIFLCLPSLLIINGVSNYKCMYFNLFMLAVEILLYISFNYFYSNVVRVENKMDKIALGTRNVTIPKLSNVTKMQNEIREVVRNIRKEQLFNYLNENQIAADVSNLRNYKQELSKNKFELILNKFNTFSDPLLTTILSVILTICLFLMQMEFSAGELDLQSIYERINNILIWTLLGFVFIKLSSYAIVRIIKKGISAKHEVLTEAIQILIDE